MRVTRCFVEAPLAVGASLVLPAQVAQHLTRVLRLRAGAAVTLFDGRGGEYCAQISRIEREAVTAQVLAHAPIERESPLPVTLLQGVARGERMDLIIQKATELGVTAMVPVSSEFSVVRLEAAAAARRQAHWQSVARSACEQCGRNRIPPVAPIQPLDAACAAAPAGARLLLAPGASHSLAAALQGARAMTLLIGPEGGLSEAEIARAQQLGFTACRLGPRVLRTETAPLVALAAIQALAGDLRD